MGPLRQQLVGVELGHHGFENLVSDGGEHLLVIFDAQSFENDREAVNIRTREDPESEVDHLEILGPGDGGESVGASADVEDVGLLKPRDQKVGPLSDGLVDNAAESVEEDSALAAVDSEEGGVEDRGA